MRGNRLARVCASGLAVAACACAQPVTDAPSAHRLSLREALGLSPSAAAKLTPVERAELRMRLDTLIASQGKGPSETPADRSVVPGAARLVLSLATDVRAVLALDTERRTRGDEPLVRSVVDGGSFTPDRAPLYGAAGPGVARAGLDVQSDPKPNDEVLQALAPMLGTPGKEGEKLQVVLVFGAPFAVLRAPATHSLYVNPAVLALADVAAVRAWITTAAPASVPVHICSVGDETCLAEALTLQSVQRCVQGVSAACIPTAALPLAALLKAKPVCEWTIRACMGDDISYSACSPLRGPLSQPCSAAGARGGETCGRMCGEGFTSLCCDGTGLTRACDDISGCGCGTNCARSCEKSCADCGAQAGADGARQCSGTCANAGQCRADACAARPPRHPPPTLVAGEPPPQRSVVLTGARDLLAFLLPPTVLLVLRRRAKQAEQRRLW